MDFRQYDRTIGRFLSPDPLFEAFVGITPYQYAFNCPVSYKDPTGLAPEKEKGDKILAFNDSYDREEMDKCTKSYIEFGQMEYEERYQSGLGLAERFGIIMRRARERNAQHFSNADAAAILAGGQDAFNRGCGLLAKRDAATGEEGAIKTLNGIIAQFWDKLILIESYIKNEGDSHFEYGFFIAKANGQLYASEIYKGKLPTQKKKNGDRKTEVDLISKIEEYLKIYPNAEIVATFHSHMKNDKGSTFYSDQDIWACYNNGVHQDMSLTKVGIFENTVLHCLIDPNTSSIYYLQTDFSKGYEFFDNSRNKSDLFNTARFYTPEAKVNQANSYYQLIKENKIYSGFTFGVIHFNGNGFKVR